MIRRSLLAFTLIATIAACSSSGSAASPAGSAPPAEAPSARPTFELSPPPFQTVPPSASPVVGEVPAAILDAATADLAALTGLDPATFTTVRAEQVLWNDGSLGCPVPGRLYVQVQTPGYWIQLEAGGKTYDYRSTTSGPVRRCDQPSPKPPSG